MHEILKGQSFVIRKKANYDEKFTCGLIVRDNVFKLYEWDEDLTEKGLRLARYEQKSDSCLKFMCWSFNRGYRTLGTVGNRSRSVTKSIRPFRMSCPWSPDKAFTACYDYSTGYLGRIEALSMLECLLPC